MVVTVYFDAVGQGFANVDDTRDSTVKIPDMDSAVFGARVEILLASGRRRGKVTTDECFENSMTRVSCHAAIAGMTG
jgi:hypothetical protein